MTEEFTQTTFLHQFTPNGLMMPTKKYIQYKLLHFNDLCGSGKLWK